MKYPDMTRLFKAMEERKKKIESLPEKEKQAQDVARHFSRAVVKT